MFTKLKTWKLTRTLLAAALAVSLLSTGMALAWPPGGKGGGGGKPPKDDPPPELPQVRYRITFPTKPPNATYHWPNDMNNHGQVVGQYRVVDVGWHAFLYDFGFNASESFDLNEFVTAGVPDGWRLQSALAINDWMVVVGSIEMPDTSQRPFAVDLAAVDPVVDLLPYVGGGGDSYALDINEYGDILGVYQTDGNWESWIFNPGLYGDPEMREPRDGTPLDMSDVDLDPLPLPVNALSFHLNNPVNGRDAQIAGQDADGVAFRYTLGADEPEWFPELKITTSDGVQALNDSGTFCGKLTKPKALYRYTDEIDKLPKIPRSSFGLLKDMNSSGDLISSERLYRDDWGERYVHIDDLVVGTDLALEQWFSLGVNLAVMNDRDVLTDSGQIAGWLSPGTAPYSIPFFLNPEPAPAP